MRGLGLGFTYVCVWVALVWLGSGQRAWTKVLRDVLYLCESGFFV